MSALMYIWQCFGADDKVSWEEEIILHKETIGPKCRFQGVTFGGKYRGYGRHIYVFDESSGTGWMFIEFTAGNGYPERHVFMEQDKGGFELIPADSSEMYTSEALWNPRSILHTIKDRVLLKKTQPAPCPPSTASQISTTQKTCSGY